MVSCPAAIVLTMTANLNADLLTIGSYAMEDFNPATQSRMGLHCTLLVPHS